MYGHIKEHSILVNQSWDNVYSEFRNKNIYMLNINYITADSLFLKYMTSCIYNAILAIFIRYGINACFK